MIFIHLIQAEYSDILVMYLDDLHHEDEGEGEEGGDQEQGDGGEEVCEHARSLVTGWKVGEITGYQ